VTALLALLIGVARAPAAYVEPGHVRLAVASWCWSRHCGAPLARSGRAATLRRGTTVRVQFAFTPTAARVAIGGASVIVLRHGTEISWLAKRSGGMTINVTGTKGFVAYVGRLVVR
jgi:hypothetical protein